MGAFFYSKTAREIPTAVLSVFRKKGFKEPVTLNTKEGILLYYSKQILSTKSIYYASKVTIVVTGTCVYKNNCFPQNMQLLANDFVANNIDTMQLRGSYIIMFITADEIAYISDAIGQYSIYYHEKSGYVSSSFLSVLVAASSSVGKLRFDKNVAVETLLTGNILGTNTLIEGITRYTPYLSDTLPGMKKLMSPVMQNTTALKHKCNLDCISEMQVKRISDEMSMYQKLFTTYGVTLGLTGGLDSRLLYLALKSAGINVSIYHNTNNHLSCDCTTASSFARSAGEHLVVHLTKGPLDFPSDEYQELLNDAFFLWDGACRIHHTWLEEKKGRNHLNKVYSSSGTGVSGVGGERFRVHDAMLSNSYQFKQWIEKGVLFENTRNIFKNTTTKSEYIDWYNNKVMYDIGLNENVNHGKISLNAIRRFYDVLFNTTNRTLRNSVENQLVFFLSPFVEPSISIMGHGRFGRHMELETKMLTMLSKSLSHIKLSYGFSPDEEPGFVIKLLPYIKKNSTITAYYALNKLRRNSNCEMCANIKYKHAFMNEYVEKVKQLQLPIDIDALLNNTELYSIVYEMGILLSTMEDCIEIA